MARSSPAGSGRFLCSHRLGLHPGCGQWRLRQPDGHLGHWRGLGAAVVRPRVAPCTASVHPATQRIPPRVHRQALCSGPGSNPRSTAGTRGEQQPSTGQAQTFSVGATTLRLFVLSSNFYYTPTVCWSYSRHEDTEMNKSCRSSSNSWFYLFRG